MQAVYHLPPAVPNEYQHFWCYLQKWACREDGWHTTAIATEVTIFSFPTPNCSLIFLLGIRGVVYSSALALCTSGLCLGKMKKAIQSACTEHMHSIREVSIQWTGLDWTLTWPLYLYSSCLECSTFFSWSIFLHIRGLFNSCVLIDLRGNTRKIKVKVPV